MISKVLDHNNLGAWYECMAVMNKLDMISGEVEGLVESEHKDTIKMSEFHMDGIVDSMSKEATKIHDWISDWMWEWEY